MIADSSGVLVEKVEMGVLVIFASGANVF